MAAPPYHEWVPMPEYAGPRRLRALLDAVLTVGSDLDLRAVLHRIVESAASLVDAQYGALGVRFNATAGAVRVFPRARTIR